jgi:hypothetical protein
MDDLRPGNGGGQPPDEGGKPRDGLPDFPPEWGAVVIPDDAAELDAEAEAIRRELGRARRAARIRRMLRRPAHQRPAVESGLGVPLTIMLAAVLTTLVSLFVVTWNHQPRPVPLTSNPPAGAGIPLADLLLADPTGQPVRLRSMLPAIIILVDQCTCIDLIAQAAAMAPPGVTVVAVGVRPPALADAPDNVRSLGDRDGIIRSRYAASVPVATDRPIVLIADRGGTVVRTVPAAGSVDEIMDVLADLPEGSTSAPTATRTT